MAGNIDAPRNPEVSMRKGVVEKPFERSRAPGATGEPAMQPDRHHARRTLAFAKKHVEGVLQISKELVA